jgi:transposase InsO family protein
MPWKEVSVVSSRREFVQLALQPGVNFAQLCRRCQISRKTGYKILGRYRLQGEGGLQDCSRRPLRSPKRTDVKIQAQVVQLREQRHWGGRKIRRRLQDLGRQPAPAASTVTDILRRHGLLDPQESLKHQAWQRFERPAPNDLWQMDFKGHFAMTPGRRCHPLTVLDDHSRYCMGLRACADEQAQTVRQRLTGIFRCYGLPWAMLMDNGAPWGSDLQNTMTVLTVWLLRLDIRVAHGRPYHPQTQGKDERFHRSMLDELLRHRRFTDLTHCQREFDAWREIYNHERPHESLQMATPASRYRPSTRDFPERLPPIEYSAHDVVRIVQAEGRIDFQGRRLGICKALRGLPIALRPTTTDGLWQVYFRHQPITTLDLRAQAK